MALKWTKLRSENSLDLGMMTTINLDGKLFAAVAGPNVLIACALLIGEYSLTTLRFDTPTDAERFVRDHAA